jgi:hypothetical protein
MFNIGDIVKYIGSEFHYNVEILSPTINYIVSAAPSLSGIRYYVGVPQNIGLDSRELTLLDDMAAHLNSEDYWEILKLIPSWRIRGLAVTSMPEYLLILVSASNIVSESVNEERGGLSFL